MANDHFFGGKIDDAFIYSVALTQEQIQKIS